MKRLIPLFLLIALTACQLDGLRAAPLPTAYPPEYVQTLVVMTAEALASPTPVPFTPTPIPPLQTPTITPTLAPFEQYTIEYLRRRSYGGGIIEPVEVQEDNSDFIRYLIRYPSDGLTMYGFMNIPKGDGPYPIVMIIHGLADTGTFNYLDYRSDLEDALTREGFIVIFPVLRGYPPSDSGDNMFRVGMSIDVLNLIAIVKTQGGQPGTLEKADPDRIGLMGQSLGGGITLRILTVIPDIKAAVLYSPVSGDELRNAQQLYRITREPQFQNELNTLPSLFLGISPMYYYSNITSPILLFQGTKDRTTPMSWAQGTCNLISTAGKSIDCIYYEGEGHIFSSEIRDDFFGSMFAFFKTYLSP